MNTLRWIWTYLCVGRILVAWFCFRLNKFRAKCKMDLSAWCSHYGFVNGKSGFFKLGHLLIHEKETRNIFLNRLHRNPIMFLMVRILFPPLDSLYLNMPPEKIGGGLIFQHGFSTIVAAERIGDNCKIFQQVTIGYNEDKNPVIEDNVIVCAGAIIIGDVCVHTGARVGAGAVVTHDVVEGSTVVGVPARAVSYKENKV